nr:MAG TPA: hypothetical protein [Bacteriophage sp.]
MTCKASIFLIQIFCIYSSLDIPVANSLTFPS